MVTRVTSSGSPTNFNWSLTYFDVNRTVSAVGDLMVVAMALNAASFNPPASTPWQDALGNDTPILDASYLNVQAPDGWTFQGADWSYIDWTLSPQYANAAAHLDGKQILGVIAVWTKELTYEDLNVTSYRFTRNAWDASSPANSGSSFAGMIGYRNAKVGGFRAGGIPTIFVPANTSQVMTIDPAPSNFTYSESVSDVIAVSWFYNQSAYWSSSALPSGMNASATAIWQNTAFGAYELTAQSGTSFDTPSLNWTVTAGANEAQGSMATAGLLLVPADPLRAMIRVVNPTVTSSGTLTPVSNFFITSPRPVLTSSGSFVDPVPAANVHDYVTSWSPFVYYKLSESAVSNWLTNVTMADSSGNGRSSTFQGSGSQVNNASSVISNYYNQNALRFVAAKFWPSPLGSGYFNTDQISLSLRIKPETVGAITSNGYFTSTSMSWILLIDSTGKLVVRVQPSNSGAYISASTSAPIELGQSYSVGFKYDGINLKLFVDGALAATTPAPTGNVYGWKLYRNASAVMYIGGSYYEGADYSGTPFTGVVANFALFDYPIPDSVFSNIHRLSITSDAPVADPAKWGSGEPTAGAVTDSYGLAVLSDSPVGFYRFDAENMCGRLF